MNTETSIPQQISRADLISLSENDVTEVACFIATQSGRIKNTVQEHLRWFLLENPARQANDPLGFGLRSADQFVGCILCSPQAFRFENQKIVFMGSSSFYVDESHRGHGGRVFLQYSRLANRWPLFGTSANPEAAALWKAAGASSIPDSDAELFGILHWPPVAEEFAHRRHPLLSRLAATSISNLAAVWRPLKFDGGTSDALQPLTSAEQVNDLVAENSCEKLTAMRDFAYIRWRYFSDRKDGIEAFAFRSRQPDQEILVTVNQRSRGYRGQIKTLNVLDVYPEVSADEWLRIAGALTHRYRTAIDAVVLRNQNQKRQKLLCDKGFRRRVFDVPTGWYIDKAGLLPACDWYPVPADCDGLI
jgi:hypothetical protein